MAVNPKFLAAVSTASKKYGVPADLLAAQIGAESNWNPNAKSPAGAVGISQFMPGTAKGYGIDPTNPMQSIDAQGKMMGSLLKSYKGDVSKALAAYNAGAGAVKKYGGVPPFKETQNYIKRIQETRSRYPGLKSGDTLPLPSGASTTAQVPETPKVATSGPPGPGQVSPFGLTAGDLFAAAKTHLGTQKASSGISYIEQALGASKQPTPAGAPLPGGGFSSVPINKLKMDKGVESTALSPSGKGIVQAALKFKGTPYSWGGGGTSGPSKGIAQGAKTVGFDCSGLVQYAVFQSTGKKIPRLASSQLAAAKPVDLQHAKPGDVIGFGTKKNVHHIGIYLGDGKFIESPHTGDVVKISNLSGRSDVVGIGRY